MGKPAIVKHKNSSLTRVKDHKAYAKASERVGIGKQHKNGVSSQRGRTTIIFRDGKRITARENGTVLKPEEIKATKRMKMSVYNALEAKNAITWV